MVEKTLRMSRRGFGGTLMGVAALAAAPQARAQAPQAAGAINIATIGEPGPLDPTLVTSDLISIITQHIFETLYTYDSMARPSKVVTLAAEAMPQVGDQGRTWTIRIRKGIRFADDPVFGGKPRELTAEDFVYSIKRLMDPRIRSPWAFLVEGKLAGLDEVAEQAKKTGRFDYDRKVPGIEAVDRYTIRFRLKATDYNLPYILAHEPTSAVAREVIEKYAETDGRAQANPVGTGPTGSRSGCAARRSSSRRTRTTAGSPGTSRRPTPRTPSSPCPRAARRPTRRATPPRPRRTRP